MHGEWHREVSLPFFFEVKIKRVYRWKRGDFRASGHLQRALKKGPEMAGSDGKIRGGTLVNFTVFTVIEEIR